MNFMDKGIDWFNAERVNNVTEKVLIRTAVNERYVLASVVEPESMVSSDGLRVQSDLYYFIVTTSTLIGLDIARGVQIIRRGRLYEVVIDGKTLKDYNDPNNIDTALAAQLRPYNPADYNPIN